MGPNKPIKDETNEIKGLKLIFGNSLNNIKDMELS